MSDLYCRKFSKLYNGSICLTENEIIVQYIVIENSKSMGHTLEEFGINKI